MDIVSGTGSTLSGNTLCHSWMTRVLKAIEVVKVFPSLAIEAGNLGILTPEEILEDEPWDSVDRKTLIEFR